MSVAGEDRSKLRCTVWTGRLDSSPSEYSEPREPHGTFRLALLPPGRTVPLAPCSCPVGWFPDLRVRQCRQVAIRLRHSALPRRGSVVPAPTPARCREIDLAQCAIKRPESVRLSHRAAVPWTHAHAQTGLLFDPG